VARARSPQKRVRNPDYDEELKRIVADTEPVECHAPAGSVIFWHSRMVHSAGRNTGTGIRSGVIYEFYKKADPAIDNSVLAEVERGNLPDMWCVLSSPASSVDFLILHLHRLEPVHKCITI
jgi:ectoine hydroxylase-related dioxygenase (phytanoyl-CoA dioxygenase family)